MTQTRIITGLHRYIDWMGNEYLLRDCEPVCNSLGDFVRADFKSRGDQCWQGAGDFDLSKARLFEPVPEQLEIEAA